MYAAKENINSKIVEKLIEFGATVSNKNASGQTAWDLIQQNEKLKSTRAYEILSN